ncbi:MAG: DUF3179 domain-containing protein [Gammaproteobacteria bacterium]
MRLNTLLPLLLLFATTVTAALPTFESPLVPRPLSAYTGAMQSGGPPKDGIPSIDDPVFRDASWGDSFLDDGDIVFGIHMNGKARAYPQRILVWHEIVNDSINDEAISVTYCPLTGSAVGFYRGDTGLGVSGRLVNSNMVMYDRDTDSYWPQILAAAIRGPLQGQGLREFRVIWTTWGRWKSRYPETGVLSDRTGYMRNYRNDPYGGYNPISGYYKSGSGPLFPLMNKDDRLAPKQTVLGFRTADAAFAVNLDTLRNKGLLQYKYAGRHFVVVHDPGLDTGWVYRSQDPLDIAPEGVTFGKNGPDNSVFRELTQVNAFKVMWFAWGAFYPGTNIIRK